ncbi:hypothetical protein Tco_0328315 [Tanacetum coccineum]
MSDPDQNKGKNSFEVDPNTILPIQSLEVGEELETDLLHATEEHSQPPSPTNKVTPSKEPTHPESQPEATHHEEPLSTEHQSPTPDVLQPKSSQPKKHKKARKPKESEPSPDSSDSESLSASLSFKDYGNYMPTNERAKHEEAAASYADLQDEIEAFHDETYKTQGNTDASLGNYEKLLLAFKEQHLKGINAILTKIYTI